MQQLIANIDEGLLTKAPRLLSPDRSTQEEIAKLQHDFAEITLRLNNETIQTYLMAVYCEAIRMVLENTTLRNHAH